MKNVFKVYILMKIIFVRYWRVNCVLVLKDCLVCEMRDYILLLIIIYRIKFSDVGFFVILCFIYFVFKIIKIICKEIY